MSQCYNMNLFKLPVLKPHLSNVRALALLNQHTIKHLYELFICVHW